MFLPNGINFVCTSIIKFNVNSIICSIFYLFYFYMVYTRVFYISVLCVQKKNVFFQNDHMSYLKRFMKCSSHIYTEI